MNTLERERIVQATTDDRVFCDLYDEFFPKIYAYTIRRVGDRDIAEDIVAATFEKVFLHLERFDPGQGTFQAWIYRITTNQIIDHTRKMKRVVVTPPEAMPDKATPAHTDAMSVMMVDESEADVRAVLARLPERYQRILLLKFFSELSNQEIAGTLAITPINAGVLLHRALKRFHTLYTDYETTS